MQYKRRILRIRKRKQGKRLAARRRAELAKARVDSLKPGPGITDVARCSATTKSGKRCSRKADRNVAGSWLCSQHAKAVVV